MLTAGIKFLNFKEKKNSLIVKKKLKLISNQTRIETLGNNSLYNWM